MIKKLIILYAFLITVLISCSENPLASDNSSNSVSFDLDSIRERGKIIAVTDFNSTNYFIYRGEPMGFNFELLESFSDYIGIDLEIITENHLEHAFNMLKTGEADLLTIGLTVNTTRKKDILFTEPIDETRQVLVQRKPRNWRSLTVKYLTGSNTIKILFRKIKATLPSCPGDLGKFLTIRSEEAICH